MAEPLSEPFTCLSTACDDHCSILVQFREMASWRMTFGSLWLWVAHRLESYVRKGVLFLRAYLFSQTECRLANVRIKVVTGSWSYLQRYV